MTSLEISTIVSEIGTLEARLAELDGVVEKAQRNYQSARGSRTFGNVMFLIGLVGIILLFDIWYLWLFLLVIGAGAYFSAKSNLKKAEKEIDGNKKEAEGVRASLAEKRALMTLLSIKGNEL